jgi:hypothetical protein
MDLLALALSVAAARRKDSGDRIAVDALGGKAVVAQKRKWWSKKSR